MKILPLLAGLLLSALPCFGDTFDLGPRGTVSVNVPAGWNARGAPITVPSNGASGYTIVFTPSAPARATGRLTFGFGEKFPATKDAVRARVREVCGHFLPGATEKKVELKKFSLARGVGFYGVLTDASMVGKEPKPNEFKVGGAGGILPEAGWFGAVAMFADSATGPEFEAMVRIIESVRVKLKAK